MEQFRIIIAGGRDFNNYELLCEKMDYLLQHVKETKQVVIISGKARGADALGERYALEHGFSVQEFPAQWDKYGKSAGYKRNITMADNADAVVAFWDGVSKGTKHMIDTATARKLKLRVVRYEMIPQE